MAFPQVRGTPTSGNSGANATTHNITLPTTIEANDLIIVGLTHDDAGASVTVSITSPASEYTFLVNNRIANGATTAARVSVWYKWAAGTEGGSTITATTTGSEGSAWIAYAISGADSGTNPEAATNAPTTNATPDPPDLNPTNWATEDTLWMVIYGWDGNVAHSSYPANYTSNQVTNRWAAANGCGIAGATRELAAASDDPGTAAIASSDQWAAATIAIRPAGAGATTVNGFGQAQADVKAIGNGFAQAQADIKATSNQFGQAQTDIKQTYTQYGQANAWIKVTNIEGFAQAQAKIYGYSDIILADSPLAYWRFGETSGTVAEDLVGTNDGTYTGGYTQGATGLLIDDTDKSVSLDGVIGSYIQVADHVSLDLGAHAQSWEIWFKRDTTSRIEVLWGKGTGTLILYYDVSNNLTLAKRDFNTILSYALSGTATHHVVVTSDGGTTNYKLYVDGLDTNASVQQPLGPVNSNDPIRFGQDSDATDPFLGTLDEAALYDYVLTAGQVAAHYAAGSGITINRGFGQAQSDIKQTYFNFAQAQALIVTTKQNFAQAQADIKSTNNAFAQAQARIMVLVGYDDFNRTIADGWGDATYKFKWLNYRDVEIGGIWDNGSVDGSAGIGAISADIEKWGDGIGDLGYGGYPLLKKGMIQFDLWVPANTEPSVDYNIDSWISGTQVLKSAGTWHVKSVFDTAYDYTFVPDASSWYTVKFTVSDISETLYAKIWKRGTQEPDWLASGTQTDTSLSPQYFYVQGLAAETPKVDNIYFWTFDTGLVHYRAGQAQAMIHRPQGYAQASVIVTGGSTASDTFTRTLSDTLGTADVGGDWLLKVGDNTQLDLNGSKIIYTPTSTNAVKYILPSIYSRIWEASIEFRVTTFGSSSTAQVQLFGSTPDTGSAQSAADDGLGAILSITNTTGAASLVVVRSTGTSSGSVSVGTIGLNEDWKIKAQGLQTNSLGIRVRAKAWRISDSEPGWQVSLDVNPAASTNLGIPAFTLRPGQTAYRAEIDNFNKFEIGWTEYAQAQAYITGISTVFAQAQSDIKSIYNTFGQAQADIKAVGFGFAQAQTDIKQTYNQHAQAQGYIFGAASVYAQAQAKIIAPNSDYQRVVFSQIPWIYLPLDESSGSTFENIIGTGNGTLDSGGIDYNVPHTVDNSSVALAIQFHNGAFFDRIYLTPTGVPTGTGDAVTVTGFLRLSNSGTQLFFGWLLYDLHYNGTYLGFNTGNSDNYGFNAQNLENRWVHIAAVFYHNQNYNIANKIYINGVEQTLTQNTGSSQTGQFYTSWALSGWMINGGEWARNTAFDEIALFKRELSSAEIQEQAKAAFPKAYAQSQAFITSLTIGSGQAQADIKATSNQFAQANADIKQTYQQYAQANAWIKVTDIEGFAQAQSDIKAVGYGFGQAQADIKAIVYVFGQTQADIKQTYLSFAQAQSDIKQTYTVSGQTQADIRATYFGAGQAQADIRQTYQSYAQAQAIIKQTYIISGQAQADIEQTYFAHAQSQADIRQIYFAHAQAQAQIKQTYFSHAQAQADVQQTYLAFGQTQADVKQTYISVAQSQANIKNTYIGVGQAQATIRGNTFGQAQAAIKATSNGFAQAQATIKATVYSVAQAQGQISVAGIGQAQAQALIYIPQFLRPVADITVTGWVRVVI